MSRCPNCGHDLYTGRHGTPGGYKYHRRMGEPPCEKCQRAWAAYFRAYRKQKREAAR
jgi:hypothetical protein